MIFFTSDQHYGGDEIRVYYERPFATMGEMDNELMARHNEKVRCTDAIIIVGDYWHEDKWSWQRYKDNLNGKKYMLHGNHSRKHVVPVKAMVVDVPFEEERYENSNLYTSRAFVTHNSEDADLNYKLNIVGHEHIRWTVKRKKNSWLVNVSVDVWNFYPVSFEDIRLAIAKGVKHGEF